MFTTDLFGPNVLIFDQSLNPSLIQNHLDLVFNQQESAQFGTTRVALLFKPGHYPIKIKEGFYTSIAGLGRSPKDTSIQGLGVPTQWMAYNNATCNFWRSAENLSVEESVSWAVSQAAPMRRMWLKNDLILHNFGAASGGFLANSVIEGMIDSGPQQQWFSRNNRWNGWKGSLWNMVFVGNQEGTQVEFLLYRVSTSWPMPPYAIVDQTPIVREKPFLIFENNQWGIFVPAFVKNSNGPSWESHEAGETIPLDEFYIVKEPFSIESVNQALQEGKHLLFTPGIYNLIEPLQIVKKNTVVLGLGYATLVASQGLPALIIEDTSGVIVSGLLIDAGEIETEVLVQVGHPKTKKKKDNPIVLSDIFIRIGGTQTHHPARAKDGMVIYADDVLGDHFWIWRADHGTWTGWNENVTRNGLVVKGDYVTIFGLFVEHFHQYNTLFEGNHGSVYFYQNELPYDMPWQREWMSHQGTKKGYAAYHVAPHVTHHLALGLGVYGVFFGNNEPIILESVFEAPEKEEVSLTHLTAVMIVDKGKNPPSSSGCYFEHIINQRGPRTDKEHKVQHLIK